MDANKKATAHMCLEGAESGTMTFPQIIKTLMEAGFEAYFADLRRAVNTYYLPTGESVEFSMTAATTPVAASFDAAVVKDAIREAQTQAPGYTYKGFCEKVMGAGCAGYIVSFSGRRVLYFGRTADIHVEHFPPAK